MKMLVAGPIPGDDQGMGKLVFSNGPIVLEDRLLHGGQVVIEDGRISDIGSGVLADADSRLVDLCGAYLVPGFIDLHVHGGAGHDFMDGTPEAFRAVCHAHLRHGTTSLCPV